jgi:hypothetical protein
MRADLEPSNTQEGADVPTGGQGWEVSRLPHTVLGSDVDRQKSRHGCGVTLGARSHHGLYVGTPEPLCRVEDSSLANAIAGVVGPVTIVLARAHGLVMRAITIQMLNLLNTPLLRNTPPARVPGAS